MSHGPAIFIHSPELEQVSYPAESPFKTNRAALTREKLLSMGLLSGPGRREAAPARATRAELETFHTRVYLDALERADRGELDPAAFAMGLGTPDCPVFRGMLDYAAFAAGASLTGARLILAGDAAVAFNPSGGYHHAGPARAAGFCYLNDIVLAALALAAAGKRVCTLDLDVHHGDGTQDAFYRRRDVLTVSLHESGRTLFPGSGFETEIGEGDGRGFCLNVPLPVGTYDAAYLHAFREAAWPVIRAFDADVIVMELGMDTLAGDPLAHLNLTNNVHPEIIGMILGLGKPVLATGGGGYHVDNTVRGWALCWSALCGESLDDLGIGLGGVMLGNTDWTGGLRDRMLISDAGRRDAVDAEIAVVIERVKKTVFPYHGL